MFICYINVFTLYNIEKLPNFKIFQWNRLGPQSQFLSFTHSSGIALNAGGGRYRGERDPILTLRKFDSLVRKEPQVLSKKSRQRGLGISQQEDQGGPPRRNAIQAGLGRTEL